MGHELLLVELSQDSSSRVCPQLADVFFAAGMVAKYTSPALTRWLIARLNKTELPKMQEAVRSRAA
jgi:hypothetical protein